MTAATPDKQAALVEKTAHADNTFDIRQHSTGPRLLLVNTTRPEFPRFDTTSISCSVLETVIIDGPVDVDIAVNGCPKLTVESLVFLLNALSDTGNGKTCNIGAKNLTKLNAIQKAIATDKGWTLT